MATSSSQPCSLNIEEAVTSWAWREYDRTATRKQRKLREKEEKKQSKYIELRIDWSNVQFRDTTKWAPLAEESFGDKSENKARGDENQNAGNNPIKSDSGLCHASTLFQTSFRNNTKEAQEYTLRTQKTTSSIMSTEIESCLTKGMEIGISLKSPGEILEANAGYKREMSLTNVQGETFEEVLEWGVESQINVPANSLADASLVVSEKKYSGDFEITSKVSGMVYITFANLRDNNTVFKATGHEITEVVKDYITKENRKGVSFPFVSVNDDYVEVTTKGSCKFRFGIKQDVVVNLKSLEKE